MTPKKIISTIIYTYWEGMKRAQIKHCYHHLYLLCWNTCFELTLSIDSNAVSYWTRMITPGKIITFFFSFLVYIIAGISGICWVNSIWSFEQRNKSPPANLIRIKTKKMVTLGMDKYKHNIRILGFDVNIYGLQIFRQCDASMYHNIVSNIHLSLGILFWWFIYQTRKFSFI